MNSSTLPKRIPEIMSSTMLKTIEETPQLLSSQQVQTIANRAWGTEMHVTHFEIESYSNEKLGFLGLHKCLKIKAHKIHETEVDSKSFFVKCVPPNNAVLSKCLQELGVFELEFYFYSAVVPLLEDGYKGDQWCPKCYAINKEVMVFEDLRMKHFSIRKKLLTKEETISALSALARMHAASILSEKKLGKPLNEVVPKAFSLDSYYNEGPRLMWFRTGIALTIHLAESLGIDSSKVKEACETWFTAVGPSRSKFNAITHSDLWSNNIMFDDRKPPKCVLVDFQMLRYCPIAQDVIVFLHLCTNRAFRKVFQIDMLKHYYQVLIDTLRLHNKEMKVPSWGELLQGVKENTPCAVSIAALYFPSVLIDGITSRDLLTDPTSYWNFMYSDRRDIVSKLMKQDKEYSDRLIEAVTELVEVSHKLDQYPLPI